MPTLYRGKDGFRLPDPQQKNDFSDLLGTGSSYALPKSERPLFRFAAARDPQTGRWHETCFRLNDQNAANRFFQQYPSTKFDLYSCPNAFLKKARKAENAAPTNIAWCDIDDGDPDAFTPRPNILWETSPGRFQAIWCLTETLSPRDAEHLSRWLAYEFGGDRNGWSVTKMLRIPNTYNHKPEYDRPRVKMIKVDLNAIAVPAAAFQWKPASASHPIAPDFAISRDFLTMNPRAVHDLYRRSLHAMVNGLIRDRRAWEGDRSKKIYQIVTGLLEAGATVDEIACLVWNSVYFRSKHGENEGALREEISRILSKLGVHDGH